MSEPPEDARLAPPVCLRCRLPMRGRGPLEQASTDDLSRVRTDNGAERELSTALAY